jgi:hypothetical protein
MVQKVISKLLQKNVIFFKFTVKKLEFSVKDWSMSEDLLRVLKRVHHSKEHLSLEMTFCESRRISLLAWKGEHEVDMSILTSTSTYWHLGAHMTNDKWQWPYTQRECVCEVHYCTTLGMYVLVVVTHQILNMPLPIPILEDAVSPWDLETVECDVINYSSAQG